MNYELPLVFFTILTQLAVGMALFNACKGRKWGVSTQAGLRREWLIIAVIAGLGLLASLFHLGQPFRAYGALAHLGGAWLSLEGLTFGLFVLVAFLAWLKPDLTWLGLAAAVLGVIGIVVQGLTYSPVSYPALNNGIPLVLFVVTALVLGSAFTLREPGPECSLVWLRISLIVWLILMLLLPTVWASGGTVVQETACLWLASPFFWGSVVLGALALGLTFLQTRFSLVIMVLVCISAILGRLVFFGCTVHTALNLGIPY